MGICNAFHRWTSAFNIHTAQWRKWKDSEWLQNICGNGTETGRRRKWQTSQVLISKRSPSVLSHFSFRYKFRFPTEQIKQLAQKGLMSACIDKKYGGSGYDLFTFTLAVEELSKCCASTGIIVSIHNCLYAELVQNFGTAQQINEFLVPLTKGNIGVFALSEHGTNYKYKIW